MASPALDPLYLWLIVTNLAVHARCIIGFWPNTGSTHVFLTNNSRRTLITWHLTDFLRFRHATPSCCCFDFFLDFSVVVYLADHCFSESTTASTSMPQCGNVTRYTEADKMRVITRELRDHPNSCFPKYTVVSAVLCLVIGLNWLVKISIQSRFCMHMSLRHAVFDHLTSRNHIAQTWLRGLILILCH